MAKNNFQWVLATDGGPNEIPVYTVLLHELSEKADYPFITVCHKSLPSFFAGEEFDTEQFREIIKVDTAPSKEEILEVLGVPAEVLIAILKS